MRALIEDTTLRQGIPVVSWGSDDEGQSSVPTNALAATRVAAGAAHSLALLSDGSIIAWGSNVDGQCTVPTPNSGFIAIATGRSHSLGVRANGSVVGWGWNYFGQCDPPAPNTGFVAVAAGDTHSLGLKSDGTIVAWGNNADGQCTLPTTNADFTAIAAGAFHSAGMKSNTNAYFWGRNDEGQVRGEDPVAQGDFIAIACGWYHTIALWSNGSVYQWGRNDEGQCGMYGLANTGFVAIAAGAFHSLGIKSDGSVVCWGLNDAGQSTEPAHNAGFIAIAAGGSHSLGISSSPKTYPTLREVGLPQNTSRRDLWLRVTPGSITAYTTRALAIVGGSDYIASEAGITPGTSVQQITLATHGVSPDMTGLAVSGEFPAGAGLAVFGYTSTPDLEVCDRIADVLRSYIGIGKALEGLVEVGVGDPGSLQRFPCVAILSQNSIDRGLTTGHSFVSMLYPITVQVAVNRMVSKQDSWRVCRQYLGALESILCDEKREIYATKAVRLLRDGVDHPAPVQGEQNPLLMAATLRLNAFVHPVWLDEEYRWS